MKVWTIANHKGGVGKTITAVSMGGLLAGMGFRTLLVDMDPHGSLTGYFRYDPDDLEESVYSLFQAAADKSVIDPLSLLVKTDTQDLNIMPASLALATLDRMEGQPAGRGLVLKNAVNQLAGDVDYVLIDCPPIVGISMINAIAACEHLIIPVQTEYLALKGLDRMLHTLSMVSQARHQPLPYTILPTMFDRRTRASIDSLRQLRETYPDHAWHSEIPVDTRFHEASRAGIPPSVFEPGARGILAYQKLLEELLQGDVSTPRDLRATG